MKKIYLFILLLTLSGTATACGGRNTEEIVAFQNNLNTIILQMEALDHKLNSLNVTADDAAETALDTLKDLNTAFENLAALQVTDENHMYIANLADEAAEYMSHAYELYQKAYSQDTFDENNADLAYQYLERATKRVRVIVTMLHGIIPDGVTIS